MALTPKDPFAIRILDQLVLLRAAGALPLVETVPGSDVWRFGFRAGGQPVSVDLDRIVSELRTYHHRDEVAMSAVPPAVMDALIGRAAVPADWPKTAPEQAIAELRRIVADWRDLNPRLYMRPPVKVGHPDNWNHA